MNESAEPSDRKRSSFSLPSCASSGLPSGAYLMQRAKLAAAPTNFLKCNKTLDKQRLGEIYNLSVFITE